MRVLLDTQCWLWLHVEPERLAAPAREIVEDRNNTLLLSAASVWEIAIKYALGKLPLPVPPTEYVPSRMERDGTEGLPIVLDHAVRVAALPPHHRDPFDRLLIAQCQAERLRILTADRLFEPYEVDVIWAV